jgi:predicted alpha/beta hydrolase
VYHISSSVDNCADWRRWHHANIELIADAEMRLVVGGTSVVITPAGITITTPSLDIIKG